MDLALEGNDDLNNYNL
ncbi:hypothetical protein [Plasmodium yoelii yoelii]|nr:hypothetical protein [Plasmodium yoelii yoelii]